MWFGSGWLAVRGPRSAPQRRGSSSLGVSRRQAKLEFLNPGGSPKDRAAKQILEEARASGRLRSGDVVVEGTSGSTGISLALLCRAWGFRSEVVLPDDAAAEKAKILETLGTRVRRVKPASITNELNYVNVARRRGQLAGHFFTDQFENPANFRAHQAHTGPEIWRQCGGVLDAFVMGAGTGGTIAGAGRFLKEQAEREGRSPVRVVLADPPGSSLFHWVAHGTAFAPQQAERTIRRHRYDTIVEGVGLDRTTANLREAVIDDAIRVEDVESVAMARRVLREEGLFVGSSSAMHLAAARTLALRLGPGHRIVTLICDRGERHLSRFWNDDFLVHSGLLVPAATEDAPAGADTSVGVGESEDRGTLAGVAGEASDDDVRRRESAGAEGP